MEVKETVIPGLLIFKPDVFGDERGFFMETFHQKRYEAFGLKEQFVQDNLSRSTRGVLRGLHFQNPFGQGKLVSVLEGSVFDVAVDVRKGSPTFGRYCGITLSGENKTQFYIPPGFAHGFCVTSETATFSYKCSDFYHPESEHSIIWNDPDIAIDWPLDSPQVSEKDQKGLALKDFDEDKLPLFEGD